MATAQKSMRAILSAGQQSKRLSVTMKDDKHMQHGQLLLSVHMLPVPLERLLAVAKLAVTFSTDILRTSEDAQDIPIMVLGHHYISHRKLGEGTAGATIPGTAAAAPTAAAATAAPATGPAVPAAAGGGTSYAAYLQEICTFDSKEGPKSYTGVQGVPLALLDMQLQPVAIAKAKRLGRELSIKVSLNPTTGSSKLQLLEYGEDYVISWPALQLLAPTAQRCPVVFKGELAVSCPTTGLFMSLQFSKDNSIKGTIEQLKDVPPITTAAAAVAAAAAVSGEAQSGAMLGKPQLLGTVSGSWTSVINVSCPKLGLEGVLYDSSTVSPAPLAHIDLAQLPPMRLCRLWSAIHDALLYADPRVAAGGRAAVKLAQTMAQYLKALTLDSAASRDVATEAAAAGGRASAGPGSAAAATKAGSAAAAAAGPLSSVLSTAGTDSDIEEFDRLLEGKVNRDGEDTRDAPPCYKAQHAAGNKLKYVLHYTLTSMPSTPAAAAS